MKKLKLDQLKVRSFVTALEDDKVQTVKGGNGSVVDTRENCGERTEFNSCYFCNVSDPVVCQTEPYDCLD
jgi:hypothetical protein